MAELVSLELVSPERLLYSGDVDMVVVPAVEGDMGVLPGHSPVIATVRPGTICIYNGASIEKRLFVAGGFLEVTEERCTVLADTATPVEDIDAAAVEAEIQSITEELAATADDSTKARSSAALLIAEAKLQAAQTPAYS